MAAYAALVTLSKAIHQLLPFQQHYSFLCAKHKMQSLLDKVNSLQQFLEHISGKSSDGIDELESRIRDVAHRLEDIVESILVHSLAMEYENEVNSRLLIQGGDTQFTVGAESRDVSRKFRKVRKTVKNSSAEASISVTAEDLSKLKITLYGRESLSTLSPGATDTKVVLEDDINQTTRHMEYGNEVNSRLSIQGAEGRAVSRKSRKPRKSVKDGSAEASISMTEEDLSKLKITLYGKESSSILSPGATKVALEDDVKQTTGHESAVPSTSAEYETSLDGKVVSKSLSVLSPGATDTKVVLEDDVNSELRSSIGKSNSEASIGEASSHLPIQEANTQLPLAAEGRAISFFRELFNKLCVACFVCTGKDTEVVLVDNVTQVSNQTISHESTAPSNYVESETEAILDDNVTQVSDQTTGHESAYAEASTSISVSAGSETETSLDDILGWCLDQDLDSKSKYSHLPLTERAAAAFRNCVKKVNFLLKEAMEMKKILNNRVVISGTSITTTSLSRGPPDANDTMVGLKDDLNQILDRITRRQPALEVIPITGMGGIGKTTLARAVYDHHRKQDHFDLVLWATVSQQYNVKDILRSLLPVDAEKREPNKTLIQLVHQRLYSRRYLIILDDVWDEKVWDGVRNAFPDHNNRSRVILTTRLSNVATNIIGSSRTHDAHQMQLLNGEQSWDLLRETVYGHEARCTGEFVNMGRRISRNCKGLPLALVVIGGLLKLNNAEDHWEYVATSTTAAAADDDSMLRILSLSYRNLPPHLNACFLYFGMFPEDKEIPTEELVRLWCAEGFLKPRESKTMEEVAEECLEELVERNLVLVMTKRYGGKIKTSIIHDVLRDLSLRQAHNEKFLYYHRGNDPIDNDTFVRIIKDQPRRVSFPEFNPECNISFSSPLRTFRTEGSIDYDQLSGMIPQFKLVRVLGAVEFSSVALRNSVRLNNLRYLHLHERWGDEQSLMVPKSISKLRNLETLSVSCEDPYSEKYDLILPVEIWEMPRLRHIIVSEEGNMILPPFPASEDSSTEPSSLQTLTGLLNFGDFSPRVIKKLQQNLKKLKIEYNQISDGHEDKVFGLQNLVNLHHLEDLTILSQYYFAPRVRNIGFPINLKKLSLRSTYLPWEKMESIGDSLKHLQVLKLFGNAFVGRVWEPIEGGFPQLKYLNIELLMDLEEWRAESAHFPSLEKLVILDCEKLKEVPAEIGDIDTLEKLIVKKHWINNSVGTGFEESVRRIEEEQQRVGNDSLQVIFLSQYQYFRHGEVVN